MTKKDNKVVVELQLNSSALISERELRKGFELPKTQQSLCAIENSAILESMYDVRPDRAACAGQGFTLLSRHGYHSLF